MKRLLPAFLAALAVSLLMSVTARPGLADEDEGGSHPRIVVRTGVEVTRDEGLAAVVFAVDFDGIDGRRHRSYFKVSSELVLNRGEGGDAIGIDSYNLRIVPITSPAAVGDLHFFPVEIMRESPFGIHDSVSLHALGWSVETEHALVPRAAGALLRDLSAFIEVSFDVLGLRYTRYFDGAQFGGFDFGRVEIEGGFNWNLSRAVTIRLTVGGEANVSVGQMDQGRGLALPYQTDVFTELEAGLHALRRDFSVFAHGERENFGLLNGRYSTDVVEFKLIVGIRAGF